MSIPAEAVQESILVVAALVGIIGGLIAAFRPIRRWLQWLESFRRDWEGEPSSAIRDGTPGVMARLNKVDGELRHNGGSSLKDSVRRLEVKSETLEHNQNLILENQKEILRQVSHAEKDITKED